MWVGAKGERNLVDWLWSQGAADVGSTQTYSMDLVWDFILPPGEDKAQILSLFLCVSFSTLIIVVTVTRSQSHGVALSEIFWL